MEPIQQGTPQWFDLKRGKIGATHMADILMKPTMAGYRNYLVKLALERMTGRTEETFCSFDMKNGIEMEPAARSCYEFETGNTVEEIAWVDHPTIPMAGCSPDGIIMVGDVIKGLAEFKCPKAATHLGYLLTEQIDRDYILQMQWQMACTGAPWVDFESYQPSFPEHLQLKIIRVSRDDVQIKALEDAAVLFNRAVEQVITDLDAI
jgi:putative phage-type endonuclease